MPNTHRQHCPDLKPLAVIFWLSAWVLAASASAAPEGIDAFWSATRANLARVPMDEAVVAVPAALPFQEYRVTLRGLDGIRFMALLALPVQGEAQAKPWPVIITAPGYNGEQQGVMLSECQRGYAILQVFPRGQGESAALWKLPGPDKLTWGLGSPQTAYYRGAYCDVIRAIDFVTTRPDLDTRRIALIGTSQGGGIVLAVAALDERVKAVVAHVPFLCDLRLAARIPSFAHQLLDRAGRNDEAALATLDFFDPLQLAARLHAPVLMSAGGRDRTCPEATIRAVYEQIPGPETLRVYPELAHTSCLAFYRETWDWLDRNLTSSPAGPASAR